MKFTIVRVFFLLAVVCSVAFCDASQTRAEVTRPKYLTLGGLVTAYAITSTSMFCEELELSPQQQDAIGGLHEQFLSSDMRRTYMAAKARAGRGTRFGQPWDAMGYFEGVFSEETEFIETFNRIVFKSLDEVLESGSKSRRLRELLTQMSLQRQDFETAIRINEIKITAAQFCLLYTSPSPRD